MPWVSISVLGCPPNLEKQCLDQISICPTGAPLSLEKQCLANPSSGLDLCIGVPPGLENQCLDQISICFEKQSLPTPAQVSDSVLGYSQPRKPVLSSNLDFPRKAAFSKPSSGYDSCTGALPETGYQALRISRSALENKRSRDQNQLWVSALGPSRNLENHCSEHQHQLSVSVLSPRT